MIVIGLVIGLGIFRTSSDAAKAALTPNVFFFAWVAGGLIALCGALTYAEIGSRLPVTGGYYKIFAVKYSLGNDINAFGGRYYNAASTFNFAGGIALHFNFK